MLRLGKGTWVLVADGEKALITCNETDGQSPKLRVIREEAQENPPNREQTADRPGRMSDGASGHRSAVEEADWHQLAKARFATDLAGILYAQTLKNRFDRLVLVAPPAVLGDLREALHGEVKKRVIGEIPKTLTNHPLAEIEKILMQDLSG